MFSNTLIPLTITCDGYNESDKSHNRVILSSPNNRTVVKEDFDMLRNSLNIMANMDPRFHFLHCEKSETEMFVIGFPASSLVEMTIEFAKFLNQMNRFSITILLDIERLNNRPNILLEEITNASEELKLSQWKKMN